MAPANVSALNRRELLRRTACGFGSLALGGILGGEAAAAVPLAGENPLAPKEPMFLPRAKRVIFIYMQGGPSHVDTFDHKPELTRSDGKEIDFVGVRFGTFGKKSKRKLMKSPWGFSRYGESGRWVSDLFPEIARHVDDLCFIHSMQTEGVAHGPSTLFMHTGATNLVRPSFGSWLTYGLGTANQNLPGFVTICPSATKGGPRNYGNAFLPAIYQGTAVGRALQSAENARIRHLSNVGVPIELQRRQFAFLQKMNQIQLERSGADDRLEATIESFELAWRMQTHAPDLFELDDESAATQRLYGIGEKTTDDFGRQCLLARRLCEAGVRFVQVNYADEGQNPRWDQHSKIRQHAIHARATDKPVAGLIADLKARGLLEDTLVWWGGEFGRTPFAQGADGRDHNPRGFTVWLAGGGVKAGHAHGSTDEIGHIAVENEMHMHDLHATILHALGIDHEKLTHRYAGRDFRLTDVHGKVVRDIFA